MKSSTIICDFCDKEIEKVSLSREVTVITSATSGDVTLRYDLCRECYVTGTSHVDTFKRIWSKVLGRPYLNKSIKERV